MSPYSRIGWARATWLQQTAGKVPATNDGSVSLRGPLTSSFQVERADL